MSTPYTKDNHNSIPVPTVAHEGVELPHYATPGASGADVRAFITADVTIPPGSWKLIPTGLRFDIPLGYEIQVRPRSGLALKHGITVLNTPGTIDADYRGELNVILANFSAQDFIITPGMRIAQLVLAPVVQASFLPITALAETTRGSSGFGHTGTH